MDKIKVKVKLVCAYQLRECLIPAGSECPCRSPNLDLPEWSKEVSRLSQECRWTVEEKLTQKGWREHYVLRKRG